MFKLLSAFQKFQPGSDLWVLFYEPQRDLFKQINWRTGFLLEKLKNQIKLFEPLIIGTEKIFPNQNLLCLPLKETWLSDTHRHWEQLLKPSLRVFLPLESSSEVFLQNWPQADLFSNLSYYMEKQT